MTKHHCYNLTSLPSMRSKITISFVILVIVTVVMFLIVINFEPLNYLLFSDLLHQSAYCNFSLPRSHGAYNGSIPRKDR